MFWILQTIFFSIVFIVVVHYLFDFLKSNLTVPIVKDLVKRPENKYQQIYDIINTAPPPIISPPLANTYVQPNNAFSQPYMQPNNNTIYTPTIANGPPSDMKSELKNFLKEQMMK